MGAARVPPLAASGDPSAGRPPVLGAVPEPPFAAGALESADQGDCGGSSELGYRPVHTLLRREEWKVNHTLVQRLYRVEGLLLRRKKPKRRRTAVERAETARVTRVNERWAMDVMHDSLPSGQMLRIFGAVDVHTRECVALRAGRGFRGDDVAAILSEAGVERAALPEVSGLKYTGHLRPSGTQGGCATEARGRVWSGRDKDRYRANRVRRCSAARSIRRDLGSPQLAVVCVC